jgi:hypothetical protein
VTPTVGLYGGYASSSFGCERVLDSLGGRCVETDIRGFDAGVRGQFPLYAVAPFLQAGLVYHTVTECVAWVTAESLKAYGFRDDPYFILTIKGAFPGVLQLNPR